MTTMNVTEILKQDAKSVNAEMVNVIFGYFVKHYRLTKAQSAKAMETFKDMTSKVNNISLEVALSTSVAVVKW